MLDVVAMETLLRSTGSGASLVANKLSCDIMNIWNWGKQCFILISSCMRIERWNRNHLLCNRNNQFNQLKSVSGPIQSTVLKIQSTEMNSKEKCKNMFKNLYLFYFRWIHNSKNVAEMEKRIWSEQGNLSIINKVEPYLLSIAFILNISSSHFTELVNYWAQRLTLQGNLSADISITHIELLWWSLIQLKCMKG